MKYTQKGFLPVDTTKSFATVTFLSVTELVTRVYFCLSVVENI
jgi:hypothetical protein